MLLVAEVDALVQAMSVYVIHLGWLVNGGVPLLYNWFVVAVAFLYPIWRQHRIHAAKNGHKGFTADVVDVAASASVITRFTSRGKKKK